MNVLLHGRHKIQGAFPHPGGGAPWRLVEKFAQFHLPLPVCSAFAVTFMQFICGLLLVAGWLTRPAAFLAGTLGIAVLLNTLADHGARLALLYALIAVAPVFTGPGRYSLDRRARPRTAGSMP